MKYNSSMQGKEVRSHVRQEGGEGPGACFPEFFSIKMVQFDAFKGPS